MIPRILQLTPWTCTVCVTRAVLEHYGYNVGISATMAALNWDISTGATLTDIRKVFRAHRLRAVSARASVRQLQQHVRRGGVAVVGINGNHVAVLHGSSSGSVILMDPSIIRKSGELSLVEFSRCYDGHAVLV